MAADPLHVAAAIGGCLEVAVRLYTVLGTLAAEAGNADSTAAHLCNKVEELSKLLETVKNTYDRNLSRTNAPLDKHEEDIWKTIKASLGRCEMTLRPFEREVSELVDRKSATRLSNIIFALRIQRFDPAISRFERGIHTHLIAMQINFCNLQVYTNTTVVNRLERILSTGAEYLKEQEKIALQSRRRRRTFPVIEAPSLEESLPGDRPGGKEETDLQILRHAVDLGHEVVHRTQNDGMPLIKTDSGVDVEPVDDVQIETLAEAAKVGDFSSVIPSADNHIGVNSRTSNGVTLLMYAARHDHFEAVEALLKAGACVNAQDQNGWNALHYAVVRLGDGSIVKRLVEAGLDVNHVCGSNRETAFQKASKSYPQSRAVMRVLVHCYANVNQPDSYGNTPLTIAVEENDFSRVSFLIQECGAVYPPGKSPANRTQSNIKKLLKTPKRRASTY